MPFPDVADWFAKCAPPLSAANVSWIWRYVPPQPRSRVILRDTVDGLLLQSQLAMADAGIAPRLSEK
ncbi:MAG: hypothetical protein WBW03_03845 [Silvibacterium sp.]